MLFYKTIYFFIGVFFTRKFKKAKINHKYAIVIAARNEEKVIGNLLDSIKKQDYPSDLITTFVVADNCTDDTAKIARKNGAICSIFVTKFYQFYKYFFFYFSLTHYYFRIHVRSFYNLNFLRGGLLCFLVLLKSGMDFHVKFSI